MRRDHTPARAASWTVIVYGDTRDDKHLVEDFYDEETRSSCQLKEPIREWLAQHEHRMTIDRGDMGEGTEHFHVVFAQQEDADAFVTLCDGLK